MPELTTENTARIEYAERISNGFAMRPLQFQLSYAKINQNFGIRGTSHRLAPTRIR